MKKQRLDVRILITFIFFFQTGFLLVVGIIYQINSCSSHVITQSHDSNSERTQQQIHAENQLLPSLQRIKSNSPFINLCPLWGL